MSNKSHGQSHVSDDTMLTVKTLYQALSVRIQYATRQHVSSMLTISKNPVHEFLGNEPVPEGTLENKRKQHSRIKQSP